MSVNRGTRDRSRCGFSWGSRCGVVRPAPWEVGGYRGGAGLVALTRLGMRWNDRQVSSTSASGVLGAAWSESRGQWAVVQVGSVRVFDRWRRQVWSYDLGSGGAGVAWGADGELVVVLGFSTTSWGGSAAQVLRFDADLELDWWYDTGGAMASVQRVVVDGDGEIYIAGDGGDEVAQRVSSAGARVWGLADELEPESYVTTVKGLALNGSGAYVAVTVDSGASGDRILRLSKGGGAIDAAAVYGVGSGVAAIAAAEGVVGATVLEVVGVDPLAYEFRADRYGAGLGPSTAQAVFADVAVGVAISEDSRHAYVGSGGRVHRLDVASWEVERVGPMVAAGTPEGLVVNPGVWVE